MKTKMTNESKHMLSSLYDAFSEKFGDNIEAWDKYLEFIAGDHSPAIMSQIKNNLTWIRKDCKLVKKIFDIYQPEILQNDRYDYLGETYRDKVISEELRDTFLPSYELTQAEATLTVEKTDETINILDPNVMTGRRILEGSKLAPNARFFGVGSDNRLVRIALTNTYIHNVKALILHATWNYHETSLEKELGRKNWLYANRWYSHIDKLKPKLVDMPKHNKYK